MWLGYLGDGDPHQLKLALGPCAKSTLHPGERFCIGISSAGRLVEPAELRLLANGHVLAIIGDETEAGCSAVVDPAKCTVRLKRDRFGLHSVYHAHDGKALWFSSKISVLLKCLPERPALNLRALHGYLAFSYVPDPDTLFNGVNSLAAGSTLTCAGAGIDIEPAPSWSSPEDDVYRGDEADAEEELRSLLRAAVRRRLQPGGRVGVFLSGGLDSSLVAALLVECGVRPELYTLDFGPAANGSDLACAKHAAQHLGCPLTIVPAVAEQVRNALNRAACAYDQPFGDGAVLPLLLLGNAASKSVDTVFNGEGGDQLFGGWANKPMIAAETYGASSKDYCRESAYLETFHRFLGLSDRLYTTRMQAACSTIDAGAWIHSALRDGGYHSLLHQLRAANLALKGAQNIAPRSIQAAEADGLALRSPFFDAGLTEWSFRLPSELLLRGACEKYLLKKVAAGYLPAEIVWREKRGMGVPTTEWCLGPLKRDVTRIVNRKALANDGLFEPGFVEMLLRGDDPTGEYRRRRIGEKLWTLLMFQIWRKEHLHG